MSVKISELPILDSLADNDVIAGVDTSANVTSKIEMATLKNYIDTNTQYTAGTNINITDNVISAPFVYDKTQTNALLDDFKDETNALIEDLETSVNEQLEEKDEQIEELQSEVDSLSTIFNAFPTENGEGESLTLDDTAEVKFKKFDLKGNTSQDTYTGKNKFATPTNTTVSGITLTNNSDGSITLNGTATANASFSSSTGLNIPSGNYVLSYTSSTAIATEKIQIATRTSSGTRLLWGWATSTSANFSSTTTDIIDYTQIVVMNGTTLNNFKIYIQLESGSTPTNFEKYVGGTASPNPSYPQPVNVVSGDNEIEVCGKNKLSPTLNDINETINGVKREGTNGIYTLSGTATAAAGSNVKYTLTNTYTIQNGDYLHLCNSTTSTNSTIILFNESDTQTQSWSFNAINRVIDISSYAGQKIKSIGFYNNSSFSESITTSPMIINSNTVTNFEPYSGNTYNIDLPEGMELCKAPNTDYEDTFLHDKTTDKWYLHKEIGKEIFDGVNKTVTYKHASIVSDTKGFYQAKLTNRISTSSSGVTNYGLANYLKFVSGSAQSSFDDNSSGIWWEGGSGGYIYFILEETSLANANAWLTTHNTDIYYPLATPTNTEITYQPLIDQLNLLEKAMSKDGQTNISQVNNDKPFILDVTAIKSLQNVLDRIELLES